MGAQRKKVLGNLADGMATITADVQTMLDLTFQAFIKNKENLLEDTNSIMEKIDDQVIELAVKVPVLELEEKEEITKILSVINSLESMKYNVIKVMNQTSTKVYDGILFTEKAVGELKILFSSVIDLVNDLNDVLITENQVLIQHIFDQVKDIEKKSQTYATEHEERLVVGQCLPKSSTLYLLILDSLRDIIWYIKSISKELAY
ncbi:MAG: hypothetical protein Q7I94_05820 [Candidatus Contubernalis sp.]|nr:hypothetical protein [Candidatus Contubernalis sp.]